VNDKIRLNRSSRITAMILVVVENQTIELDAISGATYSSKVILKAGENALRSGLTQE